MLVASLFMNLMQLKAGEGAYVPADEAHAWLEGTIVELCVPTQGAHADVAGWLRRYVRHDETD